MKTNLLTIGLIIVLILTDLTIIIAQVSPVPMGRASNIFTIIRTEQNQVYANDDLDMVAFIHRQDVTIWGGGDANNGRLRYDISIDGGATFSNDIGVLNNTYSLPARYPQMTGFNLTGSTDPLEQRLVWDAPTITPLSDWEAPVSGLSEITTSNPVTSTENYLNPTIPTFLGSGLCQGLPGEFWSFDRSYNNGIVDNDSLYLQKGTYNAMTQDIDWEIYEWIKPNHNTSFNGQNQVAATNIAFSPDGMTGWAVFLGDLFGGPDLTFNPVVIYTIDGGVTWSAPVEVDLSSVNLLTNSDCEPTTIPEVLMTTVDGNGDPIGSGIPTATFDVDITVDANGKPHMFFIVGNASTVAAPVPGYSVFSGLEKLAIDLFTEDNGLTWNAHKVSPIYTFRTPSIGAPPNQLTMDNHPQIARSPDGTQIFYSWADTDTTTIGGTATNSNPNLRIASLRTTDNFATCPKWVTLGDFIWDGNALWPTMAPEVMIADDGTFQLPVVIGQLLTGDTGAPIQFWYFGNDATISDSEYIASMTRLNVDTCTISCFEEPIPTLSQWGIIILTLLFLVIGTLSMMHLPYRRQVEN